MAVTRGGLNWLAGCLYFALFPGWKWLRSRWSTWSKLRAGDLGNSYGNGCDFAVVLVNESARLAASWSPGSRGESAGRGRRDVAC